MAILIIYREHAEGVLQVKTFRFMEEKDEILAVNKEWIVELTIEPISRGAIQQVERHFIRLLNENYLSKLVDDPMEIKKILRLYEIGARR